MKSIVVLQARTNSSRLPAKVLLPIATMPVVILAAKRAANTGKKIIIATSNESSDDGLASMVESYGFSCARGSLENTLERFVNALSDYDDSTIVFRLTADNVFPDGKLLDELEHEFNSKNLDYLCCNGEASGLPYGISVEVTRLEYLREANRESESVYDKEHVTPYIIRKFGTHPFEKYKSFQKGHFRCTIDCLDDYLCVSKVFADVENPINISAFELIEKLENCQWQPIEKHPVPKLVFGAAQLGFDYGIANKTGQPNELLCQTLIKTAIANGVMVLDTARAYGRSEEVLGKVLHGGWKERVTIVTKLSPLLECPVDATKETIKAFVDASVYQSCTALGVKNLDVLMLHRAAHIDEWEGMIWQRLLQLKASNVIKELGVSVQNPDELEKALSTQEITFIQMPFNIMDWRWDSMIAKILSAKLERKLTIHVRSSLLQGLLSSNDINLWKKANVENGEEVIQWLVKQTTFCARLNTTDLCLSYVNAQNWIDGIVIGMESLEQVIENIKYLNSPSLNDMEIQQIKKSRPKLNDTTLNPAFWRN